MERRSNIFVVFEGIDGAGKTTQIGELADYMRAQNKYLNVLLTREPTWQAQAIIDELTKSTNPMENGEAMAQGYTIDRARHYHKQIVPALHQRVTVISDRFSLSTLAYQSAQGVPLEKLVETHENLRIKAPDITIYLCISSPETLNKRVTMRKESIEKFERESDFTKRLIGQYDLIVEKSLSDERIHNLLGIVIAVNGEQPTEKVTAEMLTKLDSYWGK